MAEVEREAILSAYAEVRDKREAARVLGIGVTTLYRKLKKYGVQQPGMRDGPKFLKMPRTREEAQMAPLVCPNCHAKLMEESHADQP